MQSFAIRFYFTAIDTFTCMGETLTVQPDFSGKSFLDSQCDSSADATPMAAPAATSYQW